MRDDGRGRAGRGASVALRPDERRRDVGGVVDGVGHGDRYGSASTAASRCADPASGWQPDGVARPSAVVDAVALRVDRRRLARRRRSPTPCSTSSTSARSPRPARSTRRSTSSTRLAALGVTDVELMPLNAVPGRAQLGLRRRVRVRRPAHPTAGRRRWPASSTPPTAPGSAVVARRRLQPLRPGGQRPRRVRAVLHRRLSHAVGRRDQRRRGRQRHRAAHVPRERLPLDRGLPRRRRCASTPSHAIHDPTARPFLEELDRRPCTPPARAPGGRCS